MALIYDNQSILFIRDRQANENRILLFSKAKYIHTNPVKFIKPKHSHYKRITYAEIFLYLHTASERDSTAYIAMDAKGFIIS